jgi:GDP-L-fucose synthase
MGFAGRLAFDTDKPDGTPRKLLDVGRLSDLGWRASIDLAQGVARTCRDYRESAVPV